MSEAWRWTASEIAERVRRREISAVEVAESALGRLAAVNPKINAVVAQAPEESLEAARAVDAAVGRGEDPGALAGVPVTTKITVDQKGFATTNGIRLQKDLIAKEDNPVVANLRRAGAVIIGRTNSPAFAIRWFVRNSLHGATLNPRNPALTPGGSSGGAGSAVAAGVGAIAHGTDIGGSIRYPAYACGVQGLRPGLGRVPAANFTAPDRHIGAQLMAVSGPLARSIADLRLAFAAMSAPDYRDPWRSPAPADPGPAPKQAALCVAPDGMRTAPEVEAALREAAARLADAGWTVAETDTPPLREAAALQAVLWLADFRAGPEKLIREEADPDSSFVYDQMIRLSPDAALPDVMTALQRRLTLCREWAAFFERWPMLICPISAELPFADHSDVSSPERFAEMMQAQLTQLGLPLMGLPGLAVCTGSAGAAPVGAQLVGPRFSEPWLLDAGAEIEKRSPPIAIAEPG